MNKSKIMLTGFAILASILMLSTTCIAEPVQEQASIEAIEYSEKQLQSSIEKMVYHLKGDLYLNSQLKIISYDKRLTTLASAIESTDDLDEKMYLADSYLDILKSKREFINIQSYLDRSYLKNDIQNIDVKSDEFLALLKESISTNSLPEDYLGVDAIYVPWLNNNDDNNDGEYYSAGPFTISSSISNTISPYGSPQPDQSGFMHNTNGEMYVPGLGWVSASEYGWLEDLLLSGGIDWDALADFLSIFGLIMAWVSYFGGITAGFLCVFIGNILSNLGFTGEWWYITGEIFMFSALFGYLAGLAISDLGQWLYNHHP